MDDIKTLLKKSDQAVPTKNKPSEDLKSTKYKTVENFNKHIKENIKKDYQTRKAIVIAALSVISDYINATNKRPRYSQEKRQKSDIEGVIDDFYFDCSSFAWWTIYNAGFKLPECTIQTVDMHNWAKANGYTKNIQLGKPGDFVITTGKGHIMIIIDKDEEGYYLAEACCDEKGMKITKVSYQLLEKGGYDKSNLPYVLIDMDDYYKDKNNFR